MTRASREYCFAHSDRFGGGRDRGEVDEAAFGFRNDFVFDDENVAGLKATAAFSQGFQQFVREGVARNDFAGERDWDQAKFGGPSRSGFSRIEPLKLFPLSERFEIIAIPSQCHPEAAPFAAEGSM